jgi:calcineurin-like phosphoesterase
VSILFVGDVVGGIGKRTLLALLPSLRDRYAPDFVVVNGENVAGGVGITPKIARELLNSGVDAITLGNHTYRHREIYGYLDEEDRILRPANFLASQPGHGWCVIGGVGEGGGGRGRAGVGEGGGARGREGGGDHEGGRGRLGVISLSGNLFMQAGRPVFPEVDAALHAMSGKVDHVLVDMHAEATSEKVAMGWHLDGRVTAVVGTHTHVPTADARVLPGGTAYITDVGMTGPRGGVIGVKRDQALTSMVTHMPIRFETSSEDPWLNGVVIRTAAESMRAESIEQVLLPAPGVV